MLRMTITNESLIEELRRALPQFKLNEAYVEDQLMYPIMNDLARYVVEQSEWDDENELRASLGFVERCVSEGDSYVRDVAHECIESLSTSPPPNASDLLPARTQWRYGIS